MYHNNITQLQSDRDAISRGKANLAQIQRWMGDENREKGPALIEGALSQLLAIANCGDGVDIHLDTPRKEGAYWYHSADSGSKMLCEVVDRGGNKVIRFTTGGVQRRPWEKDYLVGPMPEFDIGDGGKLSVAANNQS